MICSHACIITTQTLSLGKVLGLLKYCGNSLYPALINHWCEFYYHILQLETDIKVSKYIFPLSALQLFASLIKNRVIKSNWSR